MEQDHCECGWRKEKTHVVCIKHRCKSERCGKRDFLPGSKALVFVLKICVQTPGLELLVAHILSCWGCAKCFSRGIRFFKIKSWFHHSSLPCCTGYEQPSSPFGALVPFLFPHLWLTQDLLGIRACSLLLLLRTYVLNRQHKKPIAISTWAWGKSTSILLGTLPSPQAVWGGWGCFPCPWAFVCPVSIFWNFL